MLERIQKIISAAGVASRRAAEQLILDGRVRVNGKVVTELGTKADAVKDHIKVDGKLINPRQPLTYIMLNKPAGYVSTLSDPEGRPTVQDLLKGVNIRVYPVGRLDYNTEGLLLMTNDGDFAHLITHPKHEFPKTYRAKVKGVLEDRQIEELEKGVYLDDGKTAPAKVKKLSKEEANSWLEITIHEGRKRQVRRMFDRVGHSVIKLKRVRTGNLVLGDLPEGSFRYLTSDEVQSLKELAVEDGNGETGSQETLPKLRMPSSRSVAPGGKSRERAGASGRAPGVREEKGSETGRPKAAAGRSPRGKRRESGWKRRGQEARNPDRGPYGKEKGRRPEPAQRTPGRGASGRGPRRQIRSKGR